MCPIRCRWSPISSSNITQADAPISRDRRRAFRASGGPFHFHLRRSPMAAWKKLREAVFIEPGEKVRLAERDTDCKALLPDKEAALAQLEEDAKAIDALQDRLF